MCVALAAQPITEQRSLVARFALKPLTRLGCQHEDSRIPRMGHTERRLWLEQVVHVPVHGNTVHVLRGVLVREDRVRKVGQKRSLIIEAAQRL